MLHTDSMKALRIILLVVGGAAALLIVAAVILVRTFDPNEYKDEITAYVQERTGRTLAIAEDIELSLFPWFAIETGGVALGDDPAFGERGFVTVDELSARVRVWPLLRRRVEIGRVVLDGIDVNLGVDESGRGNWAGLLEATAPDDPALPAADAPGRPRIEQLAVEGVELRNARVLWHDASGEVRYILRDVHFATGPIADTEPVGLELVFSLLDVASQASAEIRLEASAAPVPVPAINDIEATFRIVDAGDRERAAGTLSARSITAEGGLLRSGPAALTARLTETPVGSTAFDIAATLAALELDSSSERLVVDGLVTRIGDAEARWTLIGEQLRSAPTFGGSVDATAASITGLLTTLGIALPDGFDDANGGGNGAGNSDAITAGDIGGLAANARFAVGLDPLTVGVDAFAIEALGTEATGSAGLTAAGDLTARLELPAIDPAGPLIALLRAGLPPGTDPGSLGPASLSASLALPAARDRLEIEDLAIAIEAARLTGRVSVVDPAAPTRIEGELEAVGLDNATLAALFGAWLPSELLEADVGRFRLAAEYDYAPASRTAVLDAVELEAYGLSGNGQLTIAAGNDSVALSGQARLARFSPRALLTRFELPVPASADPTVLGAAEVAASFETTGSTGRFRDIVVELDDSRITGELSVENFADPAYRFVLRADEIDVDRYLPPRAAPGPPDEPGESSAAAADDGQRRLGDIALAEGPLTATVVNGTASVGALVIGGMRFEQLSTELALGGGRASIDPVRTQLYGGTFAGGVTVDATGDTSSVRLIGTASELAMRPLLTAMLGGAQMSGTGSFDLDLTGRGNTIGEAMQTAAGTLGFSFVNGEINGINIGRTLCAAVNSARQLPAPAAAPGVTAYTLIRASATVSEGVASTSDLLAQTSFLDMTGQGRMRLVDQWLETSHVTRLTGPIEIAGCEQLNAKVADSMPIGFTLTGTLPDVEVRPDVRQFVEDWIRRELRNEVRDQLQERAGDVLRRLLD